LRREKTTQKRKGNYKKKTPLLLNFSRVGSNYPNRVKWVFVRALYVILLYPPKGRMK
jgi:hypothetical protein